jgi:hypothetical protein
LRVLAETELPGGETWKQVRGGGEVTRMREGLPLWPWLLALALCAVVIEGVAAWRTGADTA